MNLSETFDLSESLFSQICKTEKTLANLIFVVGIHNKVCKIFNNIEDAQ